MKKSLFVALALSVSGVAAAEDYSAAAIAARHNAERNFKLEKSRIAREAECLVGIKKLNFKRKDHFDPIAEWTSFRTSQLLEKYSPCETLLMLEIAREKLLEAQQTPKNEK